MLAHITDYSAVLASVTAGLAALGWLIRQGVKVTRQVDALHTLAEYELKPNHGGSMKDRVDQIPDLANRVTSLEQAFAAHVHPPVVVVPAHNQPKGDYDEPIVRGRE